MAAAASGFQSREARRSATDEPADSREPSTEEVDVVSAEVGKTITAFQAFASTMGWDLDTTLRYALKLLEREHRGK